MAICKAYACYWHSRSSSGHLSAVPSTTTVYGATLMSWVGGWFYIGVQDYWLEMRKRYIINGRQEEGREGEGRGMEGSEGERFFHILQCCPPIETVSRVSVCLSLVLSCTLMYLDLYIHCPPCNHFGPFNIWSDCPVSTDLLVSPSHLLLLLLLPSPPPPSFSPSLDDGVWIGLLHDREPSTHSDSSDNDPDEDMSCNTQATVF